MIDLDDADAIAHGDPGGALADVEAAAEQWQAARTGVDPIDLDALDLVVFAGVGGSGIVGRLASALTRDELAVPAMMASGYTLPAAARGDRTLVIAVSASGSTEETLSVHAEATGRGCRVVAVTRGGELADRARAASQQIVSVAPGPQPRHSLGSLVVPVLEALGSGEGLDEAVEVLADARAAFGRGVPEAANPAKALGRVLAGAGGVVAWGAGDIGALGAYRLRCQMAENAKVLCSSAALPELCHNDVVGLTAPASAADDHLVWLRDPLGEHPRTVLRASVVADVVGDRFGASHTMVAGGVTPVARAASLIAQADYTSIYAALARGVDPTPIPPIDAIKAALSAA